MSNVDISELETKREKINQQAEEHRYKRDELNAQARGWAQKRDELNAQVRGFVAKAAEHRQGRDELNLKVRESKGEREKWNRKVSDLGARIEQVRRESSQKVEGPPIERLKAERRALEHKQQTTALTPAKEKELIAQISAIERTIRDREKKAENDPRVKDLVAELKVAKETAEAAHKTVNESADAAQREHDAMVALYENADRVRAEADEAQQKFLEFKALADEEHKKHVELIRQVHDYDKIIISIRERTKAEKKEKDEVDTKRQVEEIYERLKAGEKLSTEDLMILQKAENM
jgi:uncharacterized coiled-coil DUF342 family protein